MIERPLLKIGALAALAPIALGSCALPLSVATIGAVNFAGERGLLSGRAITVLEEPLGERREADLTSLDPLAAWPYGQWIGPLAERVDGKARLAAPTEVERFFASLGLSDEIADLDSAERDRLYAELARAVGADAVIAVFLVDGPSDQPFVFADGRTAKAHGRLEIYDALRGAQAWNEAIEMHSINDLPLTASDIDQALAAAAVAVIDTIDLNGSAIGALGPGETPIEPAAGPPGGVGSGNTRPGDAGSGGFGGAELLEPAPSGGRVRVQPLD